MDFLKDYGGGDSSDEDLQTESSPSADLQRVNSLGLPMINIAPSVAPSDVSKPIARIDPKTKELFYNPTYDELFQPEVNFLQI